MTSPQLCIPINSVQKNAWMLIDQECIYAVEGKSIYLDGKGYPSIWSEGRNLRVHRIIAGNPQGKEVDHKNRDPLDCRLENLRICTRHQNMQNRAPSTRNKSGFKGVCSFGDSGLWRACIIIDGRQKSLGVHKTKEAAAIAYDIAALKKDQDFAWLNFPELKNTVYREAIK